MAFLSALGEAGTAAGAAGATGATAGGGLSSIGQAIPNMMAQSGISAGNLSSGVAPPPATSPSGLEQAMNTYNKIKTTFNKPPVGMPNVPVQPAPAQVYTSDQNNDWISELLNNNRKKSGWGY